MKIISKANIAAWLVLIVCMIASPSHALSTTPVRFVFIADIQGSLPLVPPTVLSEHIANINRLNPFWVNLNRKIEAKVDAKGIYELAVPLKPKNMRAQVNPLHCTIKLTTLYKSQPKSIFIYDAQ